MLQGTNVPHLLSCNLLINGCLWASLSPPLQPFCENAQNTLSKFQMPSSSKQSRTPACWQWREFYPFAPPSQEVTLNQGRFDYLLPMICIWFLTYQAQRGRNEIKKGNVLSLSRDIIGGSILRIFL